LSRTTIKTWLEQFPEDRFGPLRRGRPMDHHIRLALGDGTKLDWEVVFLALDNDDDRKKLLSAEISDIWFNEFREMDRKIIDDADGRIGRYPSIKMGGCDNPMMIGDTNAPSETHWFAVMSGQVPMPDGLSEDDRAQRVKPANWEIFLQPPAMLVDMSDDGEVTGYRINPAAENLKWLPKHADGSPGGYYTNMVGGKSPSWIRVNILNRPGQLMAGQPVWPQFREEVHVAKSEVKPYQGHPILIGVDFGRTPAMVFSQRVFNRWFVLAEFLGNNTGARQFGPVALNFFAETFPGFTYRAWGDPAGNHQAEADDITAFLMMRAAGWTILPAPTNDPDVRIGAVTAILTEMVDGRPRCLLSPTGVPMLKAAMNGGYQFRKLKVSGDRYAEKPEKDKFSHVADAFQYAVVGAGEGRALLASADRANAGVVHAPRPAGVFQRNATNIMRAPRPGVRGFGRG
jgi:hypothetical protein